MGSAPSSDSKRALCTSHGGHRVLLSTVNGATLRSPGAGEALRLDPGGEVARLHRKGLVVASLEPIANDGLHLTKRRACLMFAAEKVYNIYRYI